MRPRLPTPCARRAIAFTLLVAACAAPAPPQQARPAPPDSQAIVLVSLDGFRYDFLDRPAAANLRALAARGVRARWMVPIFPTKTFPNHYSQVTGLYAEHHGIIANTMWDAALGWFSLDDSSAASRADPRWWGGEPLWVTAVKQGKRSATYFWPGSDVEIAGTWPTYWRRYHGGVPNAARVAQVLDWLSLPTDSAPVFITLYLNDVDHEAHDFGPDAPQTDSAIARVDSAMGALARGIEQRGLANRVNVIVVADHGMAATSPER
ncbi:MAG: ectonucleotide pyrophosphatase/phosphodiesterase, partial [Gemmatimonadales bacterium]